MTRWEDRYKPTIFDVLKAFRFHSPDPFGHDQVPWTREEISYAIAHDQGLHGQTGRVIHLQHLWEILDEMVGAGDLVARTCAEWFTVGRSHAPRSRDLLYTTPEKARMWERADRTPE